MKMKGALCAAFLLLATAGLSSAASTKNRVVELRDALNDILEENDFEVGKRSNEVPCPFHACTAEILGCSNGLKKDENGCPTCECAAPIPCPLHSCTAEMLGCEFGLKKNENGCDLCECEEALIPCPLHSCTAEMLGCEFGLKKNENNCDLCECADEQPVPCPLHSCTAEMLGCEFGLKKNENNCDLCECAQPTVIEPANVPEVPDKGICMLMPDPGPCKGSHLNFYFDRALDACQKFIYGGCHGNDNNFETFEECQAACKGKTTQPSTEKPVACPLHSCNLDCEFGQKKNENGCPLCECNEATVIEPDVVGAKETRSSEVPDKGICMLIPDPGPCKGTHLRFYFDRARDVCQKFMYGGCHGNDNNFETFEECQAACKGKTTQPSTDEPVACPMHSCNLDCEFGQKVNENGCPLCECNQPTVIEPEAAGTDVARSFEDPDKSFCSLPSVTGPCKAMIPRYYFNSDSGTCEKFTFGGCKGNENNFETEKDCSSACGNFEPPEAPEEPVDEQNESPLESTKIPPKTPIKPTESTEPPVEPTEPPVVEPTEPPVEPTEPPVEPTEPPVEPTEIVLSECEYQRQEGLKLEGKVQDGPFIPSCEEDGSFSLMQCYIYECWCSDPEGNEIYGTRVPNSEMQNMDCEGVAVNKPPMKPLDEDIERREVEAAVRELLE